MQIWEATDKTVSHRLTLSCRWLLFFGKKNRPRASGREISERKPFSMLNKWLCYIAEYPWSPNFEPEHQIQNSKEITVMRKIYLVKKNPELPADGNNWLVMNSFEFMNFIQTPEAETKRSLWAVRRLLCWRCDHHRRMWNRNRKAVAIWKG